MPRIRSMTYYEECLSLIGECTPLRRDCGQLCGKACCGTDEDGQGGVHLLPFEAEALAQKPWAEIVPAVPYSLLMCKGACEREARPFMCRIFPLAPFRKKDGEWDVRPDARARSVCPLSRSGIRALDRDFTDAARAAVRALAKGKEGSNFLERMQREEDAFRDDRKRFMDSLTRR